jgi:hypothetical protein
MAPTKLADARGEAPALKTAVLSRLHFGDLHITGASERNDRDLLELIDAANRRLAGAVDFATALRRSSDWRAKQSRFPCPSRPHMTLTALPTTSAARLSPLGPQGVFQIFPQPISIGNMHTLAVFKDRQKLFETSDVASDQFRGCDRSSLASKDGFAFCNMSLRLRQSPLNRIAVHVAKRNMMCIGNTNSPHPAQLLQ